MTRRDVRRQIALPTSWLSIGLFALVSGGMFVTNLNAFLDHSGGALSVPPPQPVNVNQDLIRPFLLQSGLAALLVLPLVTAGAYTRERRAGSLHVVLATFMGTLTLYAVMWLAPLALVATLSVYGAPEWGSIVSGALGVLLIGAAFLAVALFISSVAASAAPAGIATGALALIIVVAAWLARSGAPGAQPVFRHVSIGEMLDDFAKGVIDTGHVISCLAVVAVGLFLTLQALDPERSGH